MEIRIKESVFNDLIKTRGKGYIDELLESNLVVIVTTDDGSTESFRITKS